MPESKLSHFTTVFKVDESHRVRRNRSALSCVACQRRKSKCDRRQPCGTCIKRNDVASCHFDTSSPQVVSGGHKKELRARISKLEALVKGFAEGSSASETATNDSNGAQAADGAAVAGRGDDPKPADHVVLKGRDVGDGGTESSYHGATSWAALMSGIRDIQSLLVADGGDDFDDPEDQDMSDDADLFLGGMGIGSITMDEVTHSLPSRQDADALVTAYFNSRFVALPYLHVHQFRRRYELFWKRLAQDAHFLWISILFSVFAFGSSITQSQSQSQSHSSNTRFLPTVASARTYLSISARCLVAGNYLQANPYSVEAVIIHAHCRNTHKVDSDSSLWSLYGMAVRLAQKRGYHRDPHNISLPLSPFEAEMRRRVWFVIQSSDLLFSFQHGMPPIIDDAMCDAKPPSNLTDDDFDEHTTLLPPPRPPTDPIPILAFSYKATLARIMRRVVRNALCVEPSPYSHVLSLQDEHEKWYATLPPCLRIRTIAETAFTDQNYTIMHRLMLESMYRKSLCVLHRPYLSAYKDNPRYDHSRQICRESAIKILNHHVEFDEAMKPGGRMYGYRSMIASLTYHHFLLAAMILCIDLSESSDYSDQDRASRIQLLHSIYTIWASRSAESKDAKYATHVLRAVLNKIDHQNTPSTDSSGAVYFNTHHPAIAHPADSMDSSFPITFDEMPFLPLEDLFSSSGNGSGIDAVDWTNTSMSRPLLPIPTLGRNNPTVAGRIIILVTETPKSSPQVHKAG
ncbi:hypothetical protein QQS21_001622 [Conoideocrella luteorostrata]|uniref:Zn(2)-C6 fungal-type domain-containing protein n=1 Tax=Conoideocrella luteorostrata TaxID=1105319 RepID=A0AAJ0FY29_9HYPO|nr:hypothetical protein QQS21_001622 [Conoideocrella luteorostrata]